MSGALLLKKISGLDLIVPIAEQGASNKIISNFLFCGKLSPL